MPESTSNGGFTYRGFISYSHRDKAWADWLHKALETYRVPSRLVGKQTAHGTIPRRLNPVFRDRDELASAAELGRKVNEALGQSENLIVICSPASAASRWVNEEVLAYKRMGRGERIFCLIVEGEPNATDVPGRETEECFCPSLRFATNTDGQPIAEKAEPIAADARAGKDGKPNAKLKVIAGMLDVGFDALKQREQRRQLQRMTAIASVALVVMGVTIVLAVAAFLSRHQAVAAERKARAAQHVAVVAKQAAERRQKQAEGLVDFMLGDLTSKLQAESRGDILLSVDDKAMAYFKSLPTTDVTDAALVERAHALEEIGGVRMDQGQQAGALQAFHASAAMSSRLASETPKDADRQAAYARTVTWVGLIYQNQGKLEDAQREYETAQSVLQAALKRAPNDTNLQEQLTFSENNLGDVFLARGQLEAAQAEYAAMLAASQKLKLQAARNDDPGPYQVLIYAHAKLAGLATERGDLADAIAHRHAEVAAATEADKSFPNDNEMRVFIVAARTDFSDAARLVGDLESGVQGLEQAIKMAEQITRTDPKNGRFQRRLGNALSELAHAQRLHGAMRAADAASSRAITILSTLTREHPGDADQESDLARAEIERAMELHATGNLSGARALAQAALHILEPQFSKYPEQRDDLLPTMQARLLLASVESDATATRKLREQALQTMQAVTAGKSDPRLLALEVQTLLALDRNADAQPLIKQLGNEGYRDPDFVALMQRAHIDYPLNSALMLKLATILRTNAVSESRPPTAAPSSAK